jgi:hypothetical protein
MKQKPLESSNRSVCQLGPLPGRHVPRYGPRARRSSNVCGFSDRVRAGTIRTNVARMFLSRLQIKRWLAGNPSRAWSWAFLGCVLLFVAAIRFRLRDMPLERDEGEYAYVGQLFLHGVAPGKLAYTMKLPGTHAAYAVLMALFGQSCAGVHLGFLVVNCATIVILFLLTRALVGELAASVAAATYAAMSLSAGTLGTAAHATHFVVLAAVGGLLVLWRATHGPRVAPYFASGFILSTSVLMKQNGLFFVLFGGLWLVWLGYRRGLAPNSSFYKAAAAFCAGAAAPFLVLLAVLWAAGTLRNYWFWSAIYSRAYTRLNPGVALIWDIMMQRMPAVLRLPFRAGLLGLLALWCRRASWPVAGFATAFLFFSLLAVLPGFHFRPHYYVLLMPVLALLVGALVQVATELLRRPRLRLLVPVPTLVFTFCVASGIARERSLFFHETPLEASRSLYGFQPFPEARVLADYIRMHSPSGSRIAVLGSEPELYFYSHRQSATGYLYTYPLAEYQPFAARMQKQMKEEIEAAQPQFIVQVRSWTSWLGRPGSPKRIDDLCTAVMPPGYKLIGTCDFFPDQSRVIWHWQPNAAEEPTASSTLVIFERTVSPQY